MLPASPLPERRPIVRLLLTSLLVLPAAAQEPAAREAREWKPAGALSVGRYAPAAALLPDGRVLVAGGYSFETNATHASSEVWDPAQDRWSDGPAMRFDRNFPEALPLPGGDRLFVAGFRARAGSTATTEYLEAGGPRFRAGEPSVEERELFSWCRLQDGRFLLTGGYTTFRRKTLDSAELFDPKTGQFTRTAGKMANPRFGHASALLPDGRVLVVGGKLEATSDDILPAELFDPKTGTFTETGALTAGRDRCSAWLLADGKRVLVAGGSGKKVGTAPARRCEIYDIGAGRFSPGPELVRDRMAHTTTPLADGRVLLVGGWSGSENATTRQAELWDPRQERFLPAGLQAHGRHDHVAVLLKDGRVLVAGGKEAPGREGIQTPLTAEVWTAR